MRKILIDENKARELLESGKSFSEVSKILKVNEFTLRRKVKLLNKRTTNRAVPKGFLIDSGKKPDFKDIEKTAHEFMAHANKCFEAAETLEDICADLNEAAYLLTNKELEGAYTVSIDILRDMADGFKKDSVNRRKWHQKWKERSQNLTQALSR
jgi:hypothetical protein